MRLIDLSFLAVGLSMDACAVSIVNGMSIPELKWKHALAIALAFGVFQGVMPLIGYFLGEKSAVYLNRFDHWIAFLLLVWIGGKMIWDCFHEEVQEGQELRFGLKLLLVQAVATSIDALAVGISFAVSRVNILTAAALIALTTFLLSFIAVYIGKFSGDKLSSKAQFLGGAILIGIGLKIWIEHSFA